MPKQSKKAAARPKSSAQAVRMTTGEAVVSSLLHFASQAYVDFELDEMPVIADEVAATALHHLGGEFLRHYCQGIWLKDGQPRFYRHVDSFYSRLLQRIGKQGQPSPAGVPEPL